jgi:hypothetical protein
MLCVEAGGVRPLQNPPPRFQGTNAVRLPIRHRVHRKSPVTQVTPKRPLIIPTKPVTLLNCSSRRTECQAVQNVGFRVLEARLAERAIQLLITGSMWMSISRVAGTRFGVVENSFGGAEPPYSEQTTLSEYAEVVNQNEEGLPRFSPPPDGPFRGTVNRGIFSLFSGLIFG